MIAFLLIVIICILAPRLFSVVIKALLLISLVCGVLSVYLMVQDGTITFPIFPSATTSK